LRQLISGGLLALVCGAALGTTPESGTRNEVVFIHLNDLHANLTPHRDLVRESDASGAPVSHVETRGGLARIATAIRQIRTGTQHSVLMNIGDTYHGGVEALYSRGNAIVAPVIPNAIVASAMKEKPGLRRNIRKESRISVEKEFRVSFLIKSL
jgi:hypothetical protein